MKVLLIDDAITSATLVCQMLEKMGLRPVHAQDGESGIDLFKREKPDLMLIDIIMPGIDGFEVVRRIRQLEKDGEWTPIIFLSACTRDEDLERGIEVGGDDYLVKPVSEIVLKAKLRAMQRLAQMRHSLLVLTRKLDDANRELTRLSSVDGLTGIANRRSFDDTLQREWRHAIRRSRALSLLIVDVDQFKQFNDGYGHQAGDECLKMVAQILEQQIRRSTDLVARYGGEEFAVILPDTDAEGALCVAEKMREAVIALQIEHRYSSVEPELTVSIGTASACPSRGEEAGYMSILHYADQALYKAKRGGRNRVVQHELPEVLTSS